MNRSRSVQAIATFLLLLPSALRGDQGEDSYGDQLPHGVLARMGTVRLRHGGPTRSVAFSPDGKTLASGSEDQTIRLWETATGKSLLILKGHQGFINSVIFSPDGKTLDS